MWINEDIYKEFQQLSTSISVDLSDKEIDCKFNLIQLTHSFFSQTAFIPYYLSSALSQFSKN